MHVVDMLFFWARVEPDRLAIIQPEMVTTFRGLADAIESVSDRIDQLRLDPSEPVAVSIANPSYFLVTIFALFRCGFSVAPVNAPLLLHLRAAGIRNLIYDTQGQVLSGGRNIRFELSWLPAPSVTRRPYRHRPAGDGNLIGFTSGTTGLPKPIVRSMKALSQRYGSPITYVQNKALIIPGLAGGYGFNAACVMLYGGKTACFAPFGEPALALIDLFGIDALVASTQQALSLADIHAKSTHYNLSSLKTLRLGGALLSAQAAQRIKNHLCRNIIVWYASTEAGMTATAPYDLIADIPGAVGFLLPEVEIEIVDGDGNVLSSGAEGIIRLRTPQFVASVQATEPDKPADSLWFYPGDIGRVTEHGVLCLSGRHSDVINRGGVKVSATRIEEVLEALPQIKEAAACGIEGASGLEEIWIAVVSETSIDTTEVKRHLKEHRSIGVMVDEVFEVPTLPRNDVGKIQKHTLKETLLRRKRGT